ncbi:MAG: precorrin-6A reductase [Bacilli bacterium]
MKILMFGGTKDAKKLASNLVVKHDVTMIVATDYGKKILESYSNINIIAKRLNQIEMENLVSNNNYELVIDATHPFATAVTANVENVCRNASVKYMRLLRDFKKENKVKYFSNFVGVANYLKDVKGNILFTIGSNNLDEFKNLNNEKIFIRIIPMLASLEKVVNLGFKQSNIICMQGPFSYAMNKLLIEELNIKCLVTKESGKVSGFDEKVQAATTLGIEVLVIKRPNETGYKYSEIISELEV